MATLKPAWVIVATGALGAALLTTTTSAIPASLSTTLTSPSQLRAIASMRSDRAAHTATPLPDGNVLIIGGFTRDEFRIAETELFDTKSERFVPMAQPTEGRHSHSATILPDGRILIAGGMGQDARYLATAELFDPVTKRFTPAGQMTMARAGHEAILLDDGSVLLIGGVGTGWTFLASAEIYDPDTGIFTAVGNMQEARESHVAVRLRDGRVLVVGGHRGRGSAVVISRTAELYDPATGQFRETGLMAIPRHKHDGVLLGDGRVFIGGGADERDSKGVYTSAEFFDPNAGQFSSSPDLHLGRYKHRGTTFVLPDGKLLMLGGAAQSELYDVATGQSEVVAGENRLPGQFSAAARLPDGRALVTGGYGLGAGPRSGAWIYQDDRTGTPPPR